MATSDDLVTRARRLMTRLQFPEAEECLRNALAAEPRCVAALVGLGRLALLNRRGEDADALLDRALSLEPGCAEALALKGTYCIERQDFERAVKFLQQAGAADPKLAMVHFNLGKIHCHFGRMEAAEEEFRRAIALDREHFEAYSRLSEVQRRTGRLGAAVRSMLHAIRINPRYLKGYLVVGVLCERAGKPDAAIRTYLAGIGANRYAFPLRERLCSLYALKHDFASAFREAREIARRRNLYTDYLRLGSYAAALQQFETAERAFQTSIGLSPESWEAHYNLAELYMGARMMEQAREHYRAALERNRGGWEALNGMGLFVLIVDHDAERAIGLLRQAIEGAPSRPEPRLNLALAYAKKRDFSAAQKFAASVLALVKPGDPLYEQTERLQGTIRIEGHSFQGLK